MKLRRTSLRFRAPSTPDEHPRKQRVRQAFYAWLCCSLLMSFALTRAHAQQEPQVRVEMSSDRSQLTANENVTVRVYVQTHGAGQPEIEVPEF
ncbi:MAG TPA: hypothetical protein VFN67_03355, partial [Polyangiales bacterium]|nr:hypothetical protein [Polyangiales bacterium]